MRRRSDQTSVGCFSSPSCALIYQCSKNVALHSSKGCAIGARFWQWLNTELHGKGEESFNNELLYSVNDMLTICSSRNYISIIAVAITERFSHTGSLRTYFETEEADLGTKAGGKLRNAILTGFGSEGIMAAVCAMALVCESAL
eukprot:6204427-Pleurochrysis_carterae.AAC.6